MKYLLTYCSGIAQKIQLIILCHLHDDKNYFDVQCKHNSLRIHRTQLEGKKVMDSKDSILGYQNLGSSSLL